MGETQLHPARPVVTFFQSTSSDAEVIGLFVMTPGSGSVVLPAPAVLVVFYVSCPSTVTSGVTSV